MAPASRDGPEWGRSLSRRDALRVGVVAALASGGVGEASAAAGDRATQSVLQPLQVWKQEVEQELDPRVVVLDGPGVAIAWTDLLNDGADLFHAFDLASGERLWSKRLDGVPGLTYHDGVLYSHDYGPLVAMEPRTGEQLWAIGGERAFGHPSRFEGSYAAFSGGVEPVTVVDLSAGELAWRPADRDLAEAVALKNGQAVLFGDRELVGFDVETGEPQWRRSDLPEGEFDLDVAASWPYGFVTNVRPAETVAIDLREGTQLWEREARLYPWTFETGTDASVTLAVEDGTLSRLRPDTGETVWSTSLTEGRVFVYLVDGGLAVPVSENRIWGVALGDGTIEWTHELDTPFPLVRGAGDEFYTASATLESIDRSGTVTWRQEVTGGQLLSPDVGDGHLVAAAGSSVYGYELDAVEATTGPGDVTGDGRPATDPDGDGLHEDVDGDQQFNIVDVGKFLDRLDSDAVQDNADAFDFDGSGDVNIVDVAQLLEEL